MMTSGWQHTLIFFGIFLGKVCMLKFHYFPRSGNCYKVRLLLEQLGIIYKLQAVDLLKQENRTPEFLALSPQGKVPVLELEDGDILLESNAMLCYLAEGTTLFPASTSIEERWLRAQIWQWLFFEQYSIAPNLGPARFWTTILGQPEKFQAAIQAKQAAGEPALQALESHLTDNQFLVEDNYTIADICLYG
jgi:glutathione S-transferase